MIRVDLKSALFSNFLITQEGTLIQHKIMLFPLFDIVTS